MSEADSWADLMRSLESQHQAFRARIRARELARDMAKGAQE